MSDVKVQPPRKKQKVEWLEMEAINIRLSGLTKHQLSFPAHLSPAAVHSSRVAVHATDAANGDGHCDVFFASGRDVYFTQVGRADSTALGMIGKGGVHLPHPADKEATCQALPGVSLRSEIQSIQLSAPSAIGVSTLAASDCYGRTLLAHLRLSPSKQASQAEEDGSVDEGNSVEVMGIEHIAPGDITVEAGWTGAALAPGQPSQSAIARHFPRDVTLFDGPIPVRSLNTLHRPYAVQLLSSTVASSPAGGPVVVVAEGPTVSVWDVRAWGRGARVARLCGNPYAGHYYCLAASENAGQPVLGAAGADRSVSVWDPRKWVTMDRWTNCLKYEATSLHFMAGNPQYCIACGLDYEVVCGRWSGDKRSRLGGGTRTGDLQGVEDTAAPSISYRGDARWMGLARSHDSDVMAGITSSKQLYLAEFECGQGA